jgi:ABC-type nitrate/sulfonate/bicarbonate transport system permease component
VAFVRRLAPALVAVLVLVVVWEAYARTLPLGSFLLPAPSRIVSALWDQLDLAIHHTLVTLGETVVGFGLSLVLAIGAAVLMDLIPAVRRALYPLIVGSQALPILVVAPILILWFGYGLTPKVIVIVLLTFFPMTIGLLDGFAGVQPEAVDLLETYGASRRQALIALRWPAALPSFFTGLRIAVTYAILGAVYAEYVGSFDGLGIWILILGKSDRVDLVFGAVLIVLVLSVAAFGIVVALERALVPWAAATRASRRR